MELEKLMKIISYFENSEKSDPAEEKCECKEIKIAILQRGWVMVGRFGKSGTQCFLENASVIRTWGTTKGIGEIAMNGPIEDKTILDPCGNVEFHELTIVALLECDQSKWKKALK